MIFPNTGAYGAPQMPYGAPQMPLGVPTVGNPLVQSQQAPALQNPLGGMKRAVSFAADHQGCGFWRMHWPEAVINGNQLGIINNNNFMIFQENFYQDITSVRIQRQVTNTQLEFVKFLKNISNKTNKFKIYYEIDDVIFADDIPLYNKAREAFTDPIIGKTAIEIMRLCDGITAPTDYMAKYYEEKSGVKGITLPNYMPKFWMDRFYNKDKIVANHEQFKKRPRIGYIGSPTHFNVAGVKGVKDDFGDILNVILKTLKQFKWVIMGGCPAELAEHVRSGDIEYVGWTKIWDYPTAFNSLNVNMVIAPLQNNKFNLAKANIKHIEAGALGIPCVCQNLEPYKDAPLRFNNAEEMISIIKRTLDDRRSYLTESDIARKNACKYWLEDHIGEYCSLYFS
jgi:Glycosyl transferases group 1